MSLRTAGRVVWVTSTICYALWRERVRARREEAKRNRWYRRGLAA